MPPERNRNISERFQFTASQGGWQIPEGGEEVRTFQFTASQGGWRSISLFHLALGQHFNSQPHKEADDIFTEKINDNYISIHSLTRRLTILYCPEPPVWWFQFTASQGGWRWGMRYYRGMWAFQFTASQGGWRFHRQYKPFLYIISIHSLTRRLTVTGYAYRRYTLVFQFTASQGGWPRQHFCYEPVSLFQFTASQGGWQEILHHILGTWYFNSQPHKEADWLFQKFIFSVTNFNSQPHREADCAENGAMERMHGISIHSHTRRLT